MSSVNFPFLKGKRGGKTYFYFAWKMGESWTFLFGSKIKMCHYFRLLNTRKIKGGKTRKHDA